jgi:hypothetical protein
MEDPKCIPCNSTVTLCGKQSTNGNFPRPLPELLEGEEVFLITEATWEYESVFSDDGSMLEQYKIQHQL